MKKTLITLLMSLTACISVWASGPASLDHLVKEYKGQRGFEVLTLGQTSLGMLRGAALLLGDMDDDERAVLRAMSGIKKLVIVDYEDANLIAKARFESQLEMLLKGMEKLMEAQDDDETVRIYGREEGGQLKDCIIHSSDGDLIYLKGLLDWDQLGDLMRLKS